ncbi:MAG TPA: ABC transporter, partial [Verrucomicrobiales bacterium]|nr:ABC transporter [Verrucomicrobiales bacterium]
VLGLIGESGAGKSTIGLATLAYGRGGCRITGGEVWLRGRNILQLSPAELGKLRGSEVTYVAQSAAAAFNPSHRLIDQVVETSLGPGARRDRIEGRSIDLFRKLHLPDPDRIGERYPHQVSGGQLQRAMTAMALCPKPSLIVFDEPTTALDVTTQIEVLAAIKEAIRDEQTAALYITHDLAIVAQIADEVLVLRHGKAVEHGTAQQVLEAPREDYTRRLVAVRKIRKDASAVDSRPLLEIRGVTAAYGNAVPVLNDVSLAVPRGQTLAIVGESGSGKSTLARVATGLLPPSQGEVVFEGKPLPAKVENRSKEQLRRIQMIYQMPDTAMNPRQTVGDIIGRPLRFYFRLSGAERRARVVELLKLIEMDEKYIDRYPAELSGGQKQRVCIARAIAARPDLVICDEPTSALDPLVADEILKLMLTLQAETHVSYLFITHDIATVRAIADSIAVMYKGSIVRYGPKARVLSAPFDDYTDLLLSSVPEMRMGWLDNVLKTRRMSAGGN